MRQKNNNTFPSLFFLPLVLFVMLNVYGVVCTDSHYKIRLKYHCPNLDVKGFMGFAKSI